MTGKGKVPLGSYGLVAVALVVLAEVAEHLAVVGVVAVLARQHVDLPLVDAQLRHVAAQHEDVVALHDRVEDLRRGQLV